MAGDTCSAPDMEQPDTKNRRIRGAVVGGIVLRIEGDTMLLGPFSSRQSRQTTEAFDADRPDTNSRVRQPNVQIDSHDA